MALHCPTGNNGILAFVAPCFYCMHSTPASLLDRLRQPAAHEAWSRFVDLYTPLLYYWARHVGLHAHEAADLVQDVLVVLVEKLPQFTYDQNKSFRSWLRTVTLNRWRAQQRQKSARPLVTGAAPLDEVAAPDGDSAFGEVEYRSRLVSRALELIRADFHPVTWKACWEYAVQGRPVEDVARELGVSVNTVYLAKSRVLRRLRHELAELLD